LGFCHLVEVMLVVAHQSDVVLVVLVVTWRCVEAVGVGHCQGFIQLFSGSDLKRFRPKTLTETPSSFLALDYLGPILGSSNW
jgi:hypothetical protein